MKIFTQDSATLAIFNYKNFVHSSRLYLLGDQELRKANDFKFDHLKMRYLAAHIELRYFISHITNFPVEEIELIQNSNSKYEILNPQGWHTNMSYGNDHILLAISPTPIGIDIEPIKPQIITKELTKTIFSTEEKTFYNNLSPKERINFFFGTWTKKEAYLKFTEEGIIKPVNEINTLAANFQSNPIKHKYLKKHQLAGAICVGN